MEPLTLQEAVIFFSDPVNCREYVVARRWPDGVTCPRCGSKNVAFQDKYNRWQCNKRHNRRQFTLKTGTIFEDSPLGMDKWLIAMWQVVNCENGVSSYEIQRAIGVTQKTAWFIDHRIRLALRMGSIEKFGSGGPVEVDETMIGGLARFMHKDKKAEKITGTGGAGKELVIGLLDRETGKVHVEHVPNRKRHTLQAQVKEHVATGAEVFTDELASYTGLDREYVHQFVNHAERYVEGNVHTNGIENFWSLLKRSIKGTYVSVEPFHLYRYLDEQAFRYNERKMSDARRLDLAVRGALGKRLMFSELTGKRNGSTAIC